jgi:RNA polymerase sigma factor for flagellar operon FliA
MTFRPPVAPSADPRVESLLSASLGMLASVVAHLGRRHQLDEAEKEDLRSLLHIKLLEDEHAVLRRFEGRSSLRTYLTVVASRMLIDSRTQRWGKWRPSAIARRLGTTAVQLETLLYRDRRPPGEAVEALRRRGVPESVDTIAAFARQLPVRVRPREVAAEEAGAVAASTGADDILLDREAADVARRAESAIAVALDSLPAETAVVLKMHFLEGCPLSEVARVLGIDQKPLYRQVERALGSIRQRLESEGVSRELVEQLLSGGRLASHLEIKEVFAKRNVAAGPSL